MCQTPSVAEMTVGRVRFHSFWFRQKLESVRWCSKVLVAVLVTKPPALFTWARDSVMQSCSPTTATTRPNTTQRSSRLTCSKTPASRHKILEIADCFARMSHSHRTFSLFLITFSFHILQWLSFSPFNLKVHTVRHNECIDCKIYCKRIRKACCDDETVVSRCESIRHVLGSIKRGTCASRRPFHPQQHIKQWILILCEYSRKCFENGPAGKRATTRIELLGASSAFCQQAKGNRGPNCIHLNQDMMSSLERVDADCTYRVSAGVAASLASILENR
jgi:hypothetical protein